MPPAHELRQAVRRFASRFWTHPSVILTPHNAADTDLDEISKYVAGQIERFGAGQALQNVVDLARLFAALCPHIASIAPLAIASNSLRGTPGADRNGVSWTRCGASSARRSVREMPILQNGLSFNPAISAGLGPGAAQRKRRSASAMAISLMLASRRRIRP